MFPPGGLPHRELILVHWLGRCPVDGFSPGGERAPHPGVEPPVCLGWGSPCGGAPFSFGPWILPVCAAPKGGFFSSLQILVPSHVSSVTVYVYVWVCVCLRVRMYVCARMCMLVGVGGLGFGNIFLLFCFCFVVAFILCEALCVTNVWKVPYK